MSTQTVLESKPPVLTAYEVLNQFVETFDTLTKLIDRQNLSVNYNESLEESSSRVVVDRVQKSVYHLSSTSTSPSDSIVQLTDRINLSNSEIRDILLSLLTGKCNPVLREMLKRGAFTLKSVRLATKAGKELCRYTAQELERTGFLCRQSFVKRTTGPTTAIFGFVGVPYDTVALAKAKHLQTFNEERSNVDPLEKNRIQATIAKIIRDIHEEPKRESYKGIKYVPPKEINERIASEPGYPRPEVIEVIGALKADPGWEVGTVSDTQRKDKIATLGQKEYDIQRTIEVCRKDEYHSTTPERLQQMHPDWTREDISRIFKEIYARGGPSP